MREIASMHSLKKVDPNPHQKNCLPTIGIRLALATSAGTDGDPIVSPVTLSLTLIENVLGHYAPQLTKVTR